MDLTVKIHYIQQCTSAGWETVTEEFTFGEARERLKEYQENDKLPVRRVSRTLRLPIDEAPHFKFETFSYDLDDLSDLKTFYEWAKIKPREKAEFFFSGKRKGYMKAFNLIRCIVYGAILARQHRLKGDIEAALSLEKNYIEYYYNQLPDWAKD